MIEPVPFSLFLNPRAGVPGVTVLPSAGFRRAKAEITGWPAYQPTPLRDLRNVAGSAAVGSVQLKHEAERFGLGSFKALGGAYAVAALLQAELARRGNAGAVGTAELVSGRHRGVTGTITVTCATDGNHGRAVAWGAQRFGCRAVIFLHERVSEARATSIARFGAELRRVAGRYDDAVREAERQARAAGWHVVSDTSWPGYTEVPRGIMQGYRLMADEALDQWTGEPPTHVFVQGGVGGMAAAVSVHLRARLHPPPALIVVEPDRAACLLASAELGTPTSVPGELDTVMAGLACAEPSLLAWQELERATCGFMAVPDAAAIRAMRVAADAGIVLGESGAAGLAGLLLAAAEPSARQSLDLRPESRVLLFGTEGATDPELYQRLVGRPAASVN